MTGEPSIQWFSDESSPLPLKDKVSPFGEQRVQEYVLGRNFIPLMRAGRCAQVRLLNTDPKAWNMFMFPFDTSKKKEEVQDLDLLFGEGEFERLERRVVPDGQGVLPLQFEIKRSRSSNKLTLYIFSYEIVDYHAAVGDGEFAEVYIDANGNYEVPSNTASNVPAVLDRLIARL